MKIELRKIKIGPNSQETLNYKGDLYIDGVLVGYCTNSGQGGMTSIHGQSAYGYSIIRKAEKWAKELPPETIDGEPYPSSLDSVVDAQAYAHELSQNIIKWQGKNIVYGNPKNTKIHTAGWKGHTIASLKASESGRALLQEAIDDILSKLEEGEFILSTNIDEFLPQPEVS